MDFKFRRESITANNDTAPVNGIGLNTPDGVKYLSGESGALQFGGEAIGGGGGFVVIFSPSEDMSMTCDKTITEVKNAYLNGDNILAYVDIDDEMVGLSVNFNEIGGNIKFNGLMSMFDHGAPFITISGFMLITIVGTFTTNSWSWSMATGQATDILSQG